MTKFITADQCRMARAMKQWSRSDLAEQADVHPHTVSAVENGSDVETRTITKIVSAFELTGVEFTPDGGVKPQRVSSYLLDSYLDLLDDIHRSMPEGGEVLKHCVDDRRSSPEVISKVREMRQAGIRERLTMSDDNSFVSGNPEDYRQIPAGYFASSEAVLIFLNRVAFFVDGKALVIVSESLAKVFRDQFEYWWSEGKVPDVS